MHTPLKSSLRRNNIPIVKGGSESASASHHGDAKLSPQKSVQSKFKKESSSMKKINVDESVPKKTQNLNLLGVATIKSENVSASGLHRPSKKSPIIPEDLEIKARQLYTGSSLGNSELYTYMESLKRVVTTSEPYDEIIGHDAVKDAIENAFVSTFCMAKQVDPELSIRSVLLIGVPGIGKTGIMVNTASRIAKLIKRPISVFAISAAEILSKYIGESEKSINTLWDVVQANAPSLLLLDEVDAIMRARNNEESEHSRRMKNQLLSQMEGINPLKHVVTIAATNRGQDLDDAFLRRFKRKFILRPPTGPERIEILQKFLKKDDATKNLNLTANETKLFVDHTHNFTGDDIKTCVTFAIAASIRVCHNTELYETKQMNTIRTELEKNQNPPVAIIQPLTWEVLLRSINEVVPSLKPVDVRNLNKWAKNVCKSSSLEDSNITKVHGTKSNHGGLLSLFHLL